MRLRNCQIITVSNKVIIELSIYGGKSLIDSLVEQFSFIFFLNNDLFLQFSWNSQTLNSTNRHLIAITVSL